MGSQAVAVRGGVVRALPPSRAAPPPRLLSDLGVPVVVRIRHVLPERSRVHRSRIVGSRDRQGRGAIGVRDVHKIDVRYVRSGMGGIVVVGAQVSPHGQLARQTGHVRAVRRLALPLACRGRGVDARLLHRQRSRRRMLEGERVGRNFLCEIFRLRLLNFHENGLCWPK